MIIHQPEIIQKDGYAILWSRIELAQKRVNFPDHIWYRVPERYASYLSTHSDVFLVSGLLGGMYFNEDIEVRGSVSPRLAYHLDEYQYVLNFRKPNIVRPVSIQYERLAPLERKPFAVGTTFTGGVDSLFTVWEHLPENQTDPNYQVTHGVFIRGFDILHTENENYQQLFAEYIKQASFLGIELIELETNMLSIAHQRLDLSYLFGPFIVSSGLALSGLFKRFYVPSSWDYHMLFRTAHASDPLLDGFLSTDSMDIIHHGSTKRRVEKVEAIANWDVAQKSLWVCLDAKFEEHSWNCSRCEKCVRTMIPLYALGVMGSFEKFEKPMFRNWEVVWYARKFSLRNNFFSEMFLFLKRQMPELLPWLYLATMLGYIRYFIVKSLPTVVRQWLRRYGYFVTNDEAPDAYELLEVTHLIRGYDKS